MPADTARAKRTPRQVTEEEQRDIAQKRIRGELSCAECRRLKLRCDKNVPCASCCRRGCESICPLGILSAGQGTRFILADTERLHQKINEMSTRIRQLEDALAILQDSVSTEKHPLLDDTLLGVKFGAETLRTVHSSDETANATDGTTTIDALGTLTLTDEGEMKYFGRSAGSEALMLIGEGSPVSNEESTDATQGVNLHEELDNLSDLFPLKTGMQSLPLKTIHSSIPSRARAHALCVSYVDHGSLFFRPIKKDELFEEFLPKVYERVPPHSPIGHDSESTGQAPTATPDDEYFSAISDPCLPHMLAALFFLLAVGALFDLKLPAYNSEAEHYFDLGRAALGLRSTLLTSPQINTIRALGLMSTYCCLAGKKYSRDTAWCAMSLAAKLAQSIGLHRDSARWNMDATTVERRRALWWEVLAADISHSLALGRPPSIHLSFVDCELPIDEEATINDNDEIEFGFWRMKHIFARDLFTEVITATLTAKAPAYSTVLELDRKVREMPFPKKFSRTPRLEECGKEEYYSSGLCVRDSYATQHRAVTLLYLHRSFFAQAMLDHPTNPLLSPFASSFLTTYRSASIIIKSCAVEFDRCAPIASRVWFLLYHLFSSAVVVGTIVTRSPNSNIAECALNDLMAAVSLFEKSAPHSQRASIALAILLKLKEKAVRSYHQFRASAMGSSDSSERSNFTFDHVFSSPVDDVEHELALFGGQARVLTTKKGKRHSVGKSPSPPAVNSGSDWGPSLRVSAEPPDLAEQPQMHTGDRSAPQHSEQPNPGGSPMYSTFHDLSKRKQKQPQHPAIHAASAGWDATSSNTTARQLTLSLNPNELYSSFLQFLSSRKANLEDNLPPSTNPLVTHEAPPPSLTLNPVEEIWRGSDVAPPRNDAVEGDLFGWLLDQSNPKQVHPSFANQSYYSQAMSFSPPQNIQLPSASAMSYPIPGPSSSSNMPMDWGPHVEIQFTPDDTDTANAQLTSILPESGWRGSQW